MNPVFRFVQRSFPEEKGAVFIFRFASSLPLCEPSKIQANILSALSVDINDNYYYN